MILGLWFLCSCGVVLFHLKGYAVCRPPPLWERQLCGGCAVLAQLPCWYFSFLDVLSLVFSAEMNGSMLVFFRLFLMAFLSVVVALGMHIVILGIRNLSLRSQ